MPSLGTPQLVITDAGLAAASIATPTGPWVNITGFQIGDGYGYTPQPTDTTINGNLLYTGTPLSYSYVGNNTLNVVCQIPATAGPFNFGEIAIMMSSVMFAKGVFDTPQTKFSSLGSNVASTFTFNVLIELAQSTAILQISNVQVPPDILSVDKWSDVFPPNTTSNPDVTLLLVKEACPVTSDASLLIQSNPSQWGMGSTYDFFASAIVANSSSTYIEVSTTQLPNTALTTTPKVYVVRTADGYYRSIASIVVSGSNYRLTYVDTLSTLPAVSSNIEVYVNNSSNISSSTVNFVQQGTGFNQTNETIKIGWGTSGVGGNLQLTVNSTDYSDIWPISIVGAACFLYSGGTSSGASMRFTAMAQSGQPTGVWGGNATSDSYKYNPSNFSVNFATTAGNANNLGGVAASGYITDANLGGVGYTFVGSFTGNWSVTNSTTYTVMYMVTGGYNPFAGGNNANCYQFTIYINGVQIGEARDNNISDSKIGNILVPVQSGATIHINSSPFYGGANTGVISVYEYTMFT